MSVGVVLVCLWVLHRCVDGWCVSVCCIGMCCVGRISALDSQEGGEESLREGGSRAWAQGEARMMSQSCAAVEHDRQNV